MDSPEPDPLDERLKRVFEKWEKNAELRHKIFTARR